MKTQKDLPIVVEDFEENLDEAVEDEDIEDDTVEDDNVVDDTAVIIQDEVVVPSKVDPHAFDIKKWNDGV